MLLSVFSAMADTRNQSLHGWCHVHEAFKLCKQYLLQKLSIAGLRSNICGVHINCSTCCWYNGDQRAPVGPVLSSAVI